MDIDKLLHEHLYLAMKENDSTRKRVIRLFLSSLELARKAKRAELDDSEVISILQKEIKTKNDTIADAKKANRQDLIEESLADIKVLEEYLPKQLTEAELLILADEIIKETGAQSIRDMGLVMKELIFRLEGRATNQEASRIVRERLQS